MNDEDQSTKTFPPTPQKLLEARKKGEIARSTEILTFAGYLGFFVAFFWTGQDSLQKAGSVFIVLIDQADKLSTLFLSGQSASLHFGLIRSIAMAFLPVFLIPLLAVLGMLVATRGIVFAPNKIQPKLSKVSVFKNAQNKFGRSGLFQFFMSFSKLIIYSSVLIVFLIFRMNDMISALASEPGVIVLLMLEVCIEFLFIVVMVSLCIGIIDFAWQFFDHIRKNMMSRKEVLDETKNMEGDPHLKQERQQRAQTNASHSIVSTVPSADVVIVNPTHFAVALKWERIPGKAPICVAKGIDSVAVRIREIAHEKAVPIHSDPPIARALHATTELEEEISVEFFEAVAVAIRFSEKMKARARTV
jgi:flagellar biosynthetic protein FlhB